MAKAKSQQPKENWKEIFLAELRKMPNVTAALRKANISRTWAYGEKKTDPEFSAAWDDALEASIETAEGEVYRRSVHGTLRPVFQGGVKVGSIREYSDTLLIFWLKSRKPEVYRDPVSRLGDGEPIPIAIVKMPVDEL
jgi:hypothetical protein